MATLPKTDMMILADDPGNCTKCGKKIPYATGSATIIKGKIICRKCTKDYIDGLKSETDHVSQLAYELALDAYNRHIYNEPYNFAN